MCNVYAIYHQQGPTFQSFCITYNRAFTWIAFGLGTISKDIDLIFIKNLKVNGIGKIVVDLNQIVLSKTV